MQEKRRNLDPEDEPPEKENRVALNAVGDFDGDLYTGGKSKFEGYHTSLAVDDVEVSKKIWGWYCIPPIFKSMLYDHINFKFHSDNLYFRKMKNLYSAVEANVNKLQHH